MIQSFIFFFFPWKTHRASAYFLQFRKILLSRLSLESVHLGRLFLLSASLAVFKALFVFRLVSPLPPSVSFSLSPVPPQTARRNCYSQVIILFVRLHSAVNPLGIPPHSLLTLLQSSFSCQSQNIAEGEKRKWDKDKGIDSRRAAEDAFEMRRETVQRRGFVAAVI